MIRFYNPFSQFLTCPCNDAAKWVVKLVVPFVKGKLFHIVIMSNILPIKNGPEESFVKGKLFYIVIMSNTLPFKKGPEESFVKG